MSGGAWEYLHGRALRRAQDTAQTPRVVLDRAAAVVVGRVRGVLDDPSTTGDIQR